MCVNEQAGLGWLICSRPLKHRNRLPVLFTPIRNPEGDPEKQTVLSAYEES